MKDIEPRYAAPSYQTIISNIINISVVVAKKPRKFLLDVAPQRTSLTTGSSDKFDVVWSHFLTFLYSHITNVKNERYWAGRVPNLLTDLIQTVLACMPNSAAVERLFSVAGFVQNPQRSRLKPENLANNLLLKYNQFN